MTNAELITKIKARIERLKEEAYNSILPDEPKYRTHYKVGKKELCEELLSFLSTLESEKPMNQEGLEEEISRTYHDGSVTDTSDLDHNSYENIARHFAKWQKEQMMKEAVEGEVVIPIYEGNDVWSSEIKIPGRYELGDKVRIIVCKKED